MRIEVIGQQVQIRESPGGAVIGNLARGALVDVTGRSADRAWLFFLFWGKPAWMTASTNLIRAQGDLNALPLKGGVIELIQYSLIPDVPTPNTPFLIRLTLRSMQDIGTFKVATACKGFGYAVIPRLAPGVAQVVDLHCPGDLATGAHSTDLIIDVDQQVSVGTKQPVVYFVDGIYQQSTMLWPAYSDLNLDSGLYDLAYDGNMIRALNGATLYPLSLDSLAMVHLDIISGPPVAEATAFGVIGVATGDGRRAAIQVLEREGERLRIEFRVYEGTNNG